MHTPGMTSREWLHAEQMFQFRAFYPFSLVRGDSACLGVVTLYAVTGISCGVHGRVLLHRLLCRMVCGANRCAVSLRAVDLGSAWFSA